MGVLRWDFPCWVLFLFLFCFQFTCTKRLHNLKTLNTEGRHKFPRDICCFVRDEEPSQTLWELSVTGMAWALLSLASRSLVTPLKIKSYLIFLHVPTMYLYISTGRIFKHSSYYKAFFNRFWGGISWLYSCEHWCYRVPGPETSLGLLNTGHPSSQ